MPVYCDQTPSQEKQSDQEVHCPCLPLVNLTSLGTKLDLSNFEEGRVH